MEKVIRSVIENLREGYSFRIFSLRPVPEKENYFNHTGIPVEFGYRNNLRTYLRLFCFVTNRRKKEIFHLFNTGPHILFLLRLIAVKQIIYHIHGTIYWKNTCQKLLRKPFWTLGLNKRTRIIANSETSKKIFQRNVKQNSRIEVLYNPIELPSQKKEIKRSNELSICFSGRLSPEKNLFVWLEVAKAILEKYRNATFHLYGKGSLLPELKNYANKLNISTHVFFEGFVEQIEEMYKKHDILLFLSRHESFGNVVIESILAGTPVIATDIPAMKEIFHNYPEFLVEPGKDLVRHVLNKLEDLTELKVLTLKAQKEFRQKYSLENHLEKIKEVYEQFKA